MRKTDGLVTKERKQLTERIQGRSIVAIEWNDDYSDTTVSAFILDDGTRITFEGSGQIGQDGVWMEVK